MKANFLAFNYLPLEKNEGAFLPRNMHTIQALPAPDRR